MAFKTPSQAGYRDRTSPSRVARTTLEAEALRLRREGNACDEIAEMLGITGKDPDARVRYMLEAALERKGKPDANALRADLLDRLDRLYNRAVRISKQDRPDRVAALNAAVNVAARMSALVGSDAPKQVDLRDDRQLPTDPATRKKFLEELARKVDEEQAAGGGAVAG